MQVDQLRLAERLQDLLDRGQRGAEFVPRERNPEIALRRAGPGQRERSQRRVLLTRERSISKMRMRYCFCSNRAASSAK